ncbi:MAG TPA: hypothetical protein VI456_12590 [Polyangia bacterium]
MRIARARFGFFLGTASALGAASALSGCPGTLDTQLKELASESGGGGKASGGASGNGGSSGAGGSLDCTGNNDVNYIVMGTGSPDCPGINCTACAQSGCHVPDVPGTLSAGTSGGLDLTLDSNVGSRLVGTAAGSNSNDSSCVGKGNYLDPHSSPPTGLLIDKIAGKPACGMQMPYPGPPLGLALTSQQVACTKAWAEGLIMAAQ